jgi:hypothetical protein
LHTLRLDAQVDDFLYHTGDVVFLVRNVIFRSAWPEVASAADQLVCGMIQK